MTFLKSHPIAGFTVVSAGNPNPGAAKAGFTFGLDPAFVGSGGRSGYGHFDMSSNGRAVKWPVPSYSGKILAHFALDMVGPPNAAASGAWFFRMYNNSGASVSLELRFTMAGAVKVFDANGSDVGTSASSVINFGGDIHQSFVVEADVGNGSTGTVRVWISDLATPILDLSALDLDGSGGGGCDLLEWQNILGPGFAPALVKLRLSEVFLYDNSGPAPWNALSTIGDIRHEPLPPTSDASVEMTPSGGAPNYDEVDDPLTDDSDEDGSYVEATAASKLDQYGFGDLPGGFDVLGLLLIMEAKKTDAGAEPGDFAGRIDVSATTADTPTLGALTTSYLEYQYMFKDAPGGSGWTPAQINALKAGPKIS